MSTQTWVVHVDGAQREIFADTDPASGRTAIRVDGRMAGRPMSNLEDEREIAIGSERFIVRRVAGGGFDLDKAPPDAAAIAAARNGTAPPRKGTLSARAPQPKSSVPVGKIISAIVITAILAVVVPYLRDTVAYLRVPWQSYIHPDRSFKVSFAGAPVASSGMDGEFRTQQLMSRYRDHAYVLEWIDLGFLIPVEKERDVLDRALNAIVRARQGTLVKSDYNARSGRGSKTFIVQIPEQKDWSRGTARGEIVVDNTRVYILWAYAPQGQSLSYDIGEFLRSFELPR